MSSLPENIADTRQRLLQAAGETFAELGYRPATVRDISERAGVNIAAVNYHFGDKLGLYSAVLKHWLGAAMDKYPPDAGLPKSASPEQRLGGFVRSFLFRLLGEGVPAWHGKLMARELADPTPGIIEMLVDTHVRPHSKILFGIIRELLDETDDMSRVRACAFSVVGQCLFYRHCECMIHLIAPGQKFGPAEIERVAGHITRFTLAGLRDYQTGDLKKAKSTRPHSSTRKVPVRR